MNEDYERGKRHGEDGIMYFPGRRHDTDDRQYKAGYIDGRRHYRKLMGVWPATGESRWDKETS